MMYLIFLG